MKPDSGSQGEGIYLIREASEVRLAAGSQARQAVVQEYVQRPLLIDKLKFDIRLYVLVKALEPLQIYIAKEGLTRFCTEPYQVRRWSPSTPSPTRYDVDPLTGTQRGRQDVIHRKSQGYKIEAASMRTPRSTIQSGIVWLSWTEDDVIPSFMSDECLFFLNVYQGKRINYHVIFTSF